MNYKRKSRRQFFLLVRSRNPPISSEFREGGVTPQPPLGTPLLWRTVCHHHANLSAAILSCTHTLGNTAWLPVLGQVLRWHAWWNHKMGEATGYVNCNKFTCCSMPYRSTYESWYDVHLIYISNLTVRVISRLDAKWFIARLMTSDYFMHHEVWSLKFLYHFY